MKDNIVVAGGKAAWQLADEAIMEKLDIDHVLLGEGELSGPEMFKIHTCMRETAADIKRKSAIHRRDT